MICLELYKYNTHSPCNTFILRVKRGCIIITKSNSCSIAGDGDLLYSIVSGNSEAFASELLENLDELFSRSTTCIVIFNH